MICSTSFLPAEIILLSRREKVNKMRKSFIDCLQNGKKEPLLFTKYSILFQEIPGPPESFRASGRGQAGYCQWAGSESLRSTSSGQVSDPPSRT